jgi:hypothetical protein
VGEQVRAITESAMNGEIDFLRASKAYGIVRRLSEDVLKQSLKIYL